MIKETFASVHKSTKLFSLEPLMYVSKLSRMKITAPMQISKKLTRKNFKNKFGS